MPTQALFDILFLMCLVACSVGSVGVVELYSDWPQVFLRPCAIKVGSTMTVQHLRGCRVVLDARPNCCENGPRPDECAFYCSVILSGSMSFGARQASELLHMSLVIEVKPPIRME